MQVLIFVIIRNRDFDCNIGFVRIQTGYLDIAFGTCLDIIQRLAIFIHHQRIDTVNELINCYRCSREHVGFIGGLVLPCIEVILRNNEAHQFIIIDYQCVIRRCSLDGAIDCRNGFARCQCRHQIGRILIIPCWRCKLRNGIGNKLPVFIINREVIECNQTCGRRGFSVLCSFWNCCCACLANTDCCTGHRGLRTPVLLDDGHVARVFDIINCKLSDIIAGCLDRYSDRSEQIFVANFYKLRIICSVTIHFRMLVRIHGPDILCIRFMDIVCPFLDLNRSRAGDRHLCGRIATHVWHDVVVFIYIIQFKFCIGDRINLGSLIADIMQVLQNLQGRIGLVLYNNFLNRLG